MRVRRYAVYVLCLDDRAKRAQGPVRRMRMFWILALVGIFSWGSPGGIYDEPSVTKLVSGMFTFVQDAISVMLYFYFHPLGSSGGGFFWRRLRLAFFLVLQQTLLLHVSRVCTLRMGCGRVV